MGSKSMKSGFYHKNFTHKVGPRQLSGDVTILGDIVILEACDFEHVNVFLPTGMESAVVYQAVAGDSPTIRFIEGDRPAYKWVMGLSDPLARKIIPILKAKYVMWE